MTARDIATSDRIGPIGRKDPDVGPIARMGHVATYHRQVGAPTQPCHRVEVGIPTGCYGGLLSGGDIHHHHARVGREVVIPGAAGGHGNARAIRRPRRAGHTRCQVGQAPGIAGRHVDDPEVRGSDRDDTGTVELITESIEEPVVARRRLVRTRVPEAAAQSIVGRAIRAARRGNDGELRSVWRPGVVIDAAREVREAPRFAGTIQWQEMDLGRVLPIPRTTELLFDDLSAIAQERQGPAIRSEAGTTIVTDADRDALWRPRSRARRVERHAPDRGSIAVVSWRGCLHLADD